ncbi:MAG: L-sorbose 1-phosphate reductase [Ruminococcaceae bacterium]|nr:L-sorbose 1-phosphate reductase [Oscillospiraceae bacterium]
MKTTAVRLYGAEDLRIESFELPEIRDDEILMKVVSDSVCASTYKAVIQGPAHKRVPENIAECPIVIGHEMCGEIVKVGNDLKKDWKEGQLVVIQPALKLESGYDPGYSYQYIGGNMTYAVVPRIVLERGCLLPYSGDNFYSGSLVEPIGCCLRGFKGMYHTDYTTYTRTDGAKRGGKLAILGGAGPMGLASVELAIGYAGCSQVVVTDLNGERLAYASSKCTPESARERGCELVYLNTAECDDPVAKLLEISDGGFDDVFVMVPVPALLTMAEKISAFDGCINFFAGPAVHDMQGSLNLYRVHYDGIHLVGTAGSIPEDTVETIELIEKGLINPAVMVSHVLGLNAAPEVVLAMGKPSGVKKICYSQIDIPNVAMSDIPELAKTDPMWAEIDKIIKNNNGLWCAEAESYLLAHAPKIG